MLKIVRLIALWIWFAIGTTAYSIFFLFRPNNPLNAYLVTHHICGFGLKILGIKVDAKNIKDLYDDTPCVYIGNHQNVYDVFVYGSVFPKYAFVIGKKSLKWVPFFGWVYALSGNLYIDRKNKDSAISTMTATEDVIRNNNKSLFVFPEGTRSRGKGIGPFKKGAFHVALNTKRPVIGMVATKYDFDLNKWKSGTVGFKVLKPHYITSSETLEDDIKAIHQEFVGFQTSYVKS